MKTSKAIQISLVFIFLLTVPAVIAQNRNISTIPCESAHYHLNKLEQVVTGMCDPPPNDCPCPVDWESIDPIGIGTINMVTTTTQAFVIPSTIPSTAREILVYVRIYTGHVGSSFTLSTLSVFTEDDTTRQFIKYLPIQTYPQSAISTVSENMWFPNPSNMRVFVKLSVPLQTANMGGFVVITGYR